MKRIFCLVMVAALLLCGTALAYAEEGGSWYVQFTPEAEMVSNFQVTQKGRQGDTMNDVISAMQPGDSVTFYMELSNEHKESTDWYMTNQVLQTLEETVGQSMAEGGAYSYVLTYHGPDGTTNVLFSSDVVGGEDEANRDGREGLHEATSSLEDWFYLDTLTTGQSGNITLEVELEGETQGNRYQDTMAQLQMNFAVELTQTQTRRREFSSVRTGDEEQMLVWSGVSLACGLTALLLAVVRKRREDEEGENA